MLHCKRKSCKLSAQDNFAGIIQTTVDHLKNLLQESKINIVNHNIKMMDWLYRNGTQNVKQIIENLFVRSFRSFKKQTGHVPMEYFISIYAGKFSEDLCKAIKNGRNLIQTTLNHIIYHEKSRGKFASGFSIFMKVKLINIFLKISINLKKI
ncbi:DUF7674 family protein [Chryseobacterium indoltheticum]|uniref:DUF7674 family protein n=1 Tax=Chryseobacterium indoltheticum TaxID=254 RepID=UPI003F49204C